MKLTKEQVKKIADLSRLEVSEDQIDYYAEELSAVLDYVEQLNGVDTGKISPKIQASSLSNTTRKDEQHPELGPEREGVVKKLLQMAPFTKDGFVKVKNILDKKKK